VVKNRSTKIAKALERLLEFYAKLYEAKNLRPSINTRQKIARKLAQ
jgi:hypothetical protein